MTEWADYYVGLDLGQSADYTALAVIQRVRTYNPQTGKHPVELHLKHLERYPLKTPYTQIADNVRDLLYEVPSPGTSTTASKFAGPGRSWWWTRRASGWPSQTS